MARKSILEKYKLFKKIEAEDLRIAKKIKKKILSKYVTINNFLDKLQYNLLTAPKSKEFRLIYNLYKKIFTLPEERESYEGFEEVLGFNRDAKLRKKFGFFEEAWIYAKDPDTKKIIGAVNFSTYQMPNSIKKKYNLDGTNHTIYLFVKPEYRKIGLGKRLLEIMTNYSKSRLEGKKTLNGKSDKRLYIMCEQNAPEMMTLNEYIADNLNARIDQCDRLMWWHKIGYRRLGFRYIQPALNKDLDPCTNLTLNICTESKANVPSIIVLEHLRRFFEISVLKKQDITKDKSYKLQYAELTSIKSIPQIKNPSFVTMKNKIHKFLINNGKGIELSKPLGNFLK